MARVTLTKAELQTATGKEFIEFAAEIGSDGAIDINEISLLLSAVEPGGRFSGLSGAGFLRDTISDILKDGRIEQYEIEMLRRAIGRLFPKQLRDGSAFYSKQSIDASRPKCPSWHDDAASDKQIDLMIKLGIPFHPGISKGGASALISAHLEAKDSRPSDRQIMILRFFNRLDLMEKSRAEVADWMDVWYAEEPRRRDAWEMYKADCGEDITDPDSVEIGIGLAYLGGRGLNQPPKERIKLDVEILPHLRPKVKAAPVSFWKKILRFIRKEN